MSKIFLCMSVIPSRVLDPLFWDNLNHLKNQEEKFETLFISIPKIYKRFPGESIDLKVFEKYDWITVIPLDLDYGPACKFIGPLLYKNDSLKDCVLIVLDDDRKYSCKMVGLYNNFFKSYNHINVATGNRELYFNTFMYQCMDPKFLDIRECKSKYVSGFMSFALHCRFDWSKLLDYSFLVLEKFPQAFFHDEGILLNYFRCFDIKVYNINFKMIEFVDKEMINALCESNLNLRIPFEIDCMKWTVYYFKVKQPFILNCKLRKKILLGS